jgi:hypothetical protein
MASLASPAARIPAWKRLGLRLKNDSTSPKKRTFDEEFRDDSKPAPTEPTVSLQRNGYGNSPDERPAKKRKSVSFSDDTKKEDGSQIQKLVDDYIAENTEVEGGFAAEEASSFTTSKVHPANLEKSNGTKQPKKPNHSKKVDLAEPSAERSSQIINYLTSFHTDKPNWKFNKNLQTQLLRHIFDVSRIPPHLDEALQEYVKGLKGEVSRQRLFESLNSILDGTSDLKMATSDSEDEMSSTLHERLQAAQDQDDALNRHLFNVKVRLREEADREEAKTDEFQNLYRKRKRAQFILRALQGENRTTPPNAEEDAYERNNSSMSKNRVLSAANVAASGIAANTEGERPAKRRKFRQKVITTGMPDDDIESISSGVSSNSNSSKESSSGGSEGSDGSDSGSSSGSDNSPDSGSESRSSSASSSSSGSGSDSDSSLSDSQADSSDDD